MGASNITAAFLAWPQLENQPMRVLLCMANITYDNPTDGKPPRLYFGGWEALAELGLGRHLPQLPPKVDVSPEAEAARRARHAARVAVTQAITALSRAGAITPNRTGGWGKNAEYWLNIDAFLPRRGQGEPVTRGQGEPVTKGQGEPVLRGQGEPVPEEEQRKNRGVPTGEHLPGLASHLGDRPGRADDLVSAGFASPAARALLDQALGRVPAGRPPWCGRCYEPTRMRWTIPPDGGELLGRCPDCHPATVVVS